jgi:Skp family chaperone for outer membrane proteins
MAQRNAPRWMVSPLAVAVIAATVAGGFVYSTANSAPPPAPAPVSVALVDIAKLINELQERKDRMSAAQATLTQLELKLNETKDQVEFKKNSLGPKGTIDPKNYAERTRVIGEINELQAILKTRTEVFQHQLNVMKGDMYHQLYDKAIAAIKAVATRDGFDIVMVDDRAVTLPELGSSTEREVLGLMDNKRILYARDGLDITDRLITLMDTEYSAGRPAARPEPAAPPTPVNSR